LYTYKDGEAMIKKLTITVDEEVYSGLHKIIGRRKISHFIEDLVRPHVVKKSLDAAYKKMSQDQDREAEALDWSEGTLGDGHAAW
jgi:predicted CopG family antitoxin